MMLCMTAISAGTATISPLAVIGGQISADAEAVVVVVQNVSTPAAPAFRLSIRYAASGAEVPELSRSYSDEAEVRRVARTATVLFRSGLTVMQALTCSQSSTDSSRAPRGGVTESPPPREDKPR
jgi:hypothetical protein